MKQHDPFEVKLRHLFQEMRRVDSERTPSLDSLIHAPKRRIFPFNLFSLAAAAAIAAGIVFAFLPRAAAPSTDTLEATDLVDWKPLDSWLASTDHLLADSETEIDYALPIGTDQWLEYEMFPQSTQNNEQEEESL